jgi:hypothetical protein
VNLRKEIDRELAAPEPRRLTDVRGQLEPIVE